MSRTLDCPWCSRQLRELARAAGPEQELGAGDHFVCVHCGGISTYNGRRLEARRWSQIPEEDRADVLQARAELRGQAALS